MIQERVMAVMEASITTCTSQRPMERSVGEQAVPLTSENTA